MIHDGNPWVYLYQAFAVLYCIKMGGILSIYAAYVHLPLTH